MIKSIERKAVAKYPILGSSQNPAELALTVRGILVAIAPIILTLSGLYGWNVDSQGLTQFIDEIVKIIVTVGGVIGSVMTIAGLIRKWLNK